MWKTKFSSHKEYLFDLLFSRNAKKAHADHSILQTFFSSHKPLKVVAAKKVFLKRESISQSISIVDLTCFDKCFLFRVITGRQFFYANLLLPRGLIQSPCCCVLWEKCFEKTLHFISVISTITLQCCWY